MKVSGAGTIGSYVHSNGKLGVLVGVRCETDGVAARVVSLHVVVLANRKLMPVGGGDDEVLDARRRKLSDCPCHVADGTFHGGTGGELIDVLTKGIDLLGAHNAP